MSLADLSDPTWWNDRIQQKIDSLVALTGAEQGNSIPFFRTLAFMEVFIDLLSDSEKSEITKDSIFFLTDSGASQPGFRVKFNFDIPIDDADLFFEIASYIEQKTSIIALLPDMVKSELKNFLVAHLNDCIKSRLLPSEGIKKVGKRSAEITALIDRLIFRYQKEAIVSLYNRYFPKINLHTAYQAVNFARALKLEIWIWGNKINPGKVLSDPKNNRVFYSANLIQNDCIGIGIDKKYKKTYHFSGVFDEENSSRSIRRMQAILLLRLLPSSLNYIDIIEAIDRGEPLVPILRKKLNGLDKSFINTFMLPYQEQEGKPISASYGIISGLNSSMKLTFVREHPSEADDSLFFDLYQNENIQKIIFKLIEYRCPYKFWPNNGHEKFGMLKKQKNWLDVNKDLFQVDIYRRFTWPVHWPKNGDERASEFKDAFKTVFLDLIIPIMGSYNKINYNKINAYAYGLDDAFNKIKDIDSKNQTHYTDQSWTYKLHHALKAAMIGDRLNASLMEAVRIWHRRTATLEAVKSEHRLKALKEAGFDGELGWPALCETWQSPTSGYKVVPLLSAEDLVEEGKLMNHCVGGYYDVCRRGNSQIFSIQTEDGKRVATIEIACEFNYDKKTKKLSLGLKVAQLKGRGNSKIDDPEQLDAVGSFLSDVRSGRHKSNIARLYKFSLLEKPELDGGENETSKLPPEQLYPYYRALLPAPVPATYQEWKDKFGLDKIFHDVFAAISQDKLQNARQQSENSQVEAPVEQLAGTTEPLSRLLMRM